MTRRVKIQIGCTLSEKDFPFFMTKLTTNARQRKLMDRLFQKTHVMMLVYKTKLQHLGGS